MLENNNSIILGIETSCDDTSVAVLADGNKILSNLISSQITIHEKFGGVVPEVASRKHLESINPLIDLALKESEVSFNEIDGIAVTYGPGLVGSLLVGVACAKALSFALEKPLLPVNHILAHIYANFLLPERPQLPLLALVVSGGHTSLVLMEEHLKPQLIGQTRDDAAGEAYDKTARALKLGYPGGPIIDRLAGEGNPDKINFPRANLGKGREFDFSFSGLKSSVLNHINQAKMKNEVINVEDLSASFQAAVVEVLIDKTIKAKDHYNIKNVVLAGGVAANSTLRLKMKESVEKNQGNFYCPPLKLCTDNAAMVACVGHFLYRQGIRGSFDLNAVPGLVLGQT